MNPDKKWQEGFKRVQAFLRSINNCTLCSEPLTLIHEVDKAQKRIEEEAVCKTCQITARRKKYHLH